MKNLDKIKRTLAAGVLWLCFSVLIWLAILFLYVDIANPEKITMFERIMSGLVSLNVAERTVEFLVDMLTNTDSPYDKRVNEEKAGEG